MSARILSFVRPGKHPLAASARRCRYADAWRTSLLWVREAIGLIALATLLAWLVVRFAH